MKVCIFFNVESFEFVPWRSLEAFGMEQLNQKCCFALVASKL
jgi:hypothetical protein